MKYHVIYKQQGRVLETEVEAESIADCERKMFELRPRATGVLVGVPLVEEVKDEWEDSDLGEYA